MAFSGREKIYSISIRIPEGNDTMFASGGTRCYSAQKRSVVCLLREGTVAKVPKEDRQNERQKWPMLRESPKKKQGFK